MTKTLGGFEEKARVKSASIRFQFAGKMLRRRRISLKPEAFEHLKRKIKQKQSSCKRKDKAGGSFGVKTLQTPN